MRFRTRQIRALLFGIFLGGSTPGFLFFVTTSIWMGWLTASVMTLRVAAVRVGISLSLTNEQKNNQRNFWGLMARYATVV